MKIHASKPNRSGFSGYVYASASENGVFCVSTAAHTAAGSSDTDNKDVYLDKAGALRLAEAVKTWADVQPDPKPAWVLEFDDSTGDRVDTVGLSHRFWIRNTRDRGKEYQRPDRITSLTRTDAHQLRDALTAWLDEKS